MSGSFSVDTNSLRQFQAAVERAQTQVGELSALVDAAALPPGTFTRTEPGQVCDQGHADMLAGIRTRVEAAVEQLRAVAEATTSSINHYESTDATHAATMGEIQTQLDTMPRI